MRIGRSGSPPAEDRIQVIPTIAVSNLKQINLVKKKDNLLSKLLILRSRERKYAFPSSAMGTDLPFPCAAAFPRQLANKLRGANKIYVLGIGMNWKSDDRLGIALAQALAKKLPLCPDIRVSSGGEAPENFTGAIRAFAPSHVILLDAVDHGLKPGTVFLADERSIAVGDMTSHHLPLKLLMRFLGASLPCRVILIGVQPQNLLPGSKLSASVKKTLPFLAAFLAEALREQIKN
jgi:hydrogenase 3 maturation protease